jgi:hypothetical protein
MDAATERKMTEGEVRSPNLLRFIMMIALVVASVAATAAAAVVLIPDSSDYVLAGRLKHERLTSLPSPKIVLIGGSNLAYGIDGRTLEQDTKCPIVNMGLNGYLGVRLILEESTPHLQASDTVVISLEYQNFFNPTDGDPSSQFMLAKSNPQIWEFLSWRQKLAALSQMPLVAQEKVFRVIRSIVSPPDNNEELATILSIESFSGFDEYGGLTSHLGVTWPYEEVDRFDLSSATIAPDVLPLLQSFAEEMSARGIRVAYSYSPVKRSFYDEHETAIQALHARLTALSSLGVMNPPETFAYDDALFFDSIYHLGAEGRLIRSKQLAVDIRGAVFKGEDCMAAPLGKRVE